MSEDKEQLRQRSTNISGVERGIALGFAGAVLVTFLALVLAPRAMNDGTLAIVRFLAATFAGISGYLVVPEKPIRAAGDRLQRIEDNRLRRIVDNC